MRIFQFILCVLVTPLLVASARNLSDEYRDWQEARQLQLRSQDEVKNLVVERDLMKTQVEALKSDKFAKERLARRLGYVNPDDAITEVAHATDEPTSGHPHAR